MQQAAHLQIIFSRNFFNDDCDWSKFMAYSNRMRLPFTYYGLRFTSNDDYASVKIFTKYFTVMAYVLRLKT